MGQIWVTAADLSGDKITKLKVAIHGLPDRLLDREAAIGLLKDGHSLIPRTAAGPTSALQLVEIGDPLATFIRVDNLPEGSDALPPLPSVAG